MSQFHNMLLSADGGEGNGGGNTPPVQSPTPATPAAQPSAPVTPSAPAQRTISDQEFQQYQSFKGKAQSYDGTLNRFRNEFGVQNFDEAAERLGRMKQIESDDTLKQIIDAIAARPANNGTLSQPSIGNQPLDLNKLPQYVQESVEKVFQAREQREFELAHWNAAAVETSLISSATADPRFRGFFGEKSFDDNLAGAGDPDGRFVAAMIDMEFARLAGKYDDGKTLRPITDQAKANEAFDSVHSALQRIRAKLLLEASGPTMPIPTRSTAAAAASPAPSSFGGSPWPSQDKVRQTVHQEAAALGIA